MAKRDTAPPQEEEIVLADALEQVPDDIDEKARLVRTQLALMLRLMPKLRSTAAEAIQPQTPAVVGAT
ncbi:hypothetical protein D3C71_2017610 [compost metagenome]